MVCGTIIGGTIPEHVHLTEINTPRVITDTTVNSTGGGVTHHLRLGESLTLSDYSEGGALMMWR